MNVHTLFCAGMARWLPAATHGTAAARGALPRPRANVPGLPQRRLTSALVRSVLLATLAATTAPAAFAQVSAPADTTASAPAAAITASTAAPTAAPIAAPEKTPDSAPATAPASATVAPVTASAPLSDADALVQRGAYLARAGDCIACHMAKGGKPFAGGLPIATPIGTIYSTNITPSTTHGIGNYTEAQFAAALREGKRADGAQLYPAMPYTSYAKLNDDDVKALYAYFMHGVAPVDDPAPKTALPFPFNIRMSMAGWNLLFLDSKPYQADPSKNAEWNRGAYLVEGLAHCSTCHTPRNFLMAEETSKALSGGAVGTWFSPNITSDATSGLGNWTQADIAKYLRTGFIPGKAQAAGPMAEAIEHSFSHLSDSDLQAIAAYIKTVAPVHDAVDTQAPDTWGAPLKTADDVRGQAWPDDANKLNGAQLYDANCASCHQAHGEGSPDGSLPSLFHNTALGHANTDNLVMAILQGVQHAPGTTTVDMPAFGKSLTDEQVATLGNFLVQQYGNPTAKVTVEQVATLRAGGKPSPLLTIARVGMGVAALIIVLLLGWALKRRRAA